MSRYFCVFQTSVSREVASKAAEQIKTVSAQQCNAFKSTCEQHSKEFNGQWLKQVKCIGHTLIRSGNKLSSPELSGIAESALAEAQQFNALVDELKREIETRMSSPLYQPYRRRLLESNAAKKIDLSSVNDDGIKCNPLMLGSDVNSLNQWISDITLYQDIASRPNFAQVNNDIAAYGLLDKSKKTVQTLMNDCICYSDCNGYSVCYCYGNCQHY